MCNFGRKEVQVIRLSKISYFIRDGFFMWVKIYASVFSTR
ncbi:hypothetical protein DYY67_0806 [Candidatus Nitrosotalea sp. TS]|nr:hypothetical protein [Candidatus Nitrosotalea sp. TS]